ILDDQAGGTIQQGGPPYFGRFKPQQPLSQLDGKNAHGRYTLVIKNDGTNPGQINSWSLTLKKPIPVSGLGEAVADQTSLSFRIFTMAGDNPLSHSEWTAVGPAGIFAGTHHTSRIGGIAVDPSAPSGNTVYNSNSLAITYPLRDHVFLDTTAYKIVVDPKPTPSGQVIIYAAMGGARPGIYRSVDSGKHWQNTTANIPELQTAEATDVVL